MARPTPVLRTLVCLLVAAAASPRDVFAGAPRWSSGRGAVDVQQDGRVAQVLTRASLRLGTAAPGDGFGTALAQERTTTGCSLLVVGAPGVAGTGAVHVVVDTPGGFAGGAAALTVRAPQGAPGDRFGETVLLSRSAVAGDNGSFELWVGAPGRDVGSARDAGAVERYRLTPGSGQVTVTHLQTLQQGTAAVPGTSAESGDRFGEVLAGAERGVVVGVAREDVGSAADAGMVVLVGPSGGTYRGLRNVTQSTTGIAGSPEPGDRFGAAVAECGHLIGVPGEDLGRLADAGTVHELLGCDPLQLQPGRTLSQDSPGVPGTDEAGDQFGAAVVQTYAYEEGPSAKIGVPGEDAGSLRDAGRFVGEYACGLPPCGWDSWSQGDHLRGVKEAGDRMGAALHVRHVYDVTEFGSYATSFPVAAAPGEDLGSVPDAGAAFTRVLDEDTGGVDEVQLTFSAGPVAGLQFGPVLARTTYGQPYR